MLEMVELLETQLEDRVEFLNEENLPAMIRSVAGETLEDLLRAEREPLREMLRRYGAILFRGFALRTAEDFQKAANQCFEGELLPYLGGLSPRGQVKEGIFESTKLPAYMRLAQHHEMSYLPIPPRAIAFFCEVEPQEGGETPLADSRKVYKRIPAGLRERFEHSGVCYHRTLYGPGRNFVYAALNRWLKVRRSWMETFLTTDRSVVERVCAEQGGTAHWDREGGVRISNVLPAVRRHPETGEKLWFNHVTTFLMTPESAGTMRYLFYRLAYLNPLHRPVHATMGNGEAITLAQLRAINKAVDSATVRFKWKRGDLLLVDNFQVTHGRMPFRGPRRILVAMN
jgi:alpha-ketoglutarate-dependent taurine dioxygenase